MCRDWRKNKNPEDELRCRNRKLPAFGSGVDLNRFNAVCGMKLIIFCLFYRNFGYKWEDSRPKAQRKCSPVYHGLGSFSENETRAIRVGCIVYSLKFYNSVSVTASIMEDGVRY